jgi:hypothetical protein
VPCTHFFRSGVPRERFLVGVMDQSLWDAINGQVEALESQAKKAKTSGEAASGSSSSIAPSEVSVPQDGISKELVEAKKDILKKDQIIGELKGKILSLENDLEEVQRELAAASSVVRFELGPSVKDDHFIAHLLEEKRDAIIESMDGLSADEAKDRFSSPDMVKYHGIPKEKARAMRHSIIKMKCLTFPIKIILLMLKPAESLCLRGSMFSSLSPVHSPAACCVQPLSFESCFRTEVRHRQSGSRKGAPYKAFVALVAPFTVVYSRTKAEEFYASYLATSTPAPASDGMSCLPVAKRVPGSPAGVVDGIPVAEGVALEHPAFSPRVEKILLSMDMDENAIRIRSSDGLIMAPSGSLSADEVVLRDRVIRDIAFDPICLQPPKPKPLSISGLSEGTGVQPEFIPACDRKSLESAVAAMEARIYLHQEWIEALAGGPQAYAATPPAELRISVRRFLKERGGKRGDYLARLALALDYYTAYVAALPDPPPTLPILPALLSNAGMAKMVESPAWLRGEGTSIAPTFVSVLHSAYENMSLPMEISPLSKSVPKHVKPKGQSKACPVPLGVWERLEEIWCDPATPMPLAYLAGNVCMMILTSCRAQDWILSDIFDEWDLGAAICFNIAVTKSNNERNTKVALSDQGLRSKLPISKYRALFAKYGPNPVPVDAQGRPCPPSKLEAATGLARGGVESTSDLAHLGKWVRTMYAVAGISEAARKRIRLTPHSPHHTFDNLATIFMWRERVKDQFGRWARGSAAGYAHRAATETQLRIRATMMDALFSILPKGGLSMEPNFRVLSESPALRESAFYGPLAV